MAVSSPGMHSKTSAPEPTGNDGTKAAAREAILRELDAPFYTRAYARPRISHTDRRVNDGGLLVRRNVSILMTQAEWDWWAEQAQRHGQVREGEPDVGSAIAVAAGCWVQQNQDALCPKEA